ncbi:MULTISPECIES: BREX-1 system adenine-specific DNA-methyltransferase PglX [unclassified Adlercreutzia]|uniref:BREX-1 system adenine-specific DNA-methyltransferase PglX n=1 Tax=unclassified Adlercreutzia TaxID=2636013 RepID=UPI0013EB8232|nr:MULTISPECIES: BREX-1 system adenine-specific DNA-methyltransferase PglX [unclassified Adlercreutzia]
MNDTAVKNFCTWARAELLRQVRQRALYWGIREDGHDPKDADVIEGRVLSGAEKRRRGLLIDKLGPAAGAGYADSFERLMEEAAYTWFNRMAAIRFMELNDRIPRRVRILSGEDGSFSPQVLTRALDVRIEGLDADRVVEAMGSGDDEALFRLLFLAQCNELSRCMPDVFEPVGSAMELLLPAGLLHHDGVLAHLVSDIPESDWREGEGEDAGEGVRIVGWMYQYYVSERKDEVFAGFKKGRKAERDAIAPATQLFTPEWIVRYLVENSLGRLWMQNTPSSQLAGRMPYYIANEDDARVAFRRVSSPEEITVVDPACGSGHILVYAFDLLASIYEEAGYVRRDIPRLVLENNLSGMEIDPRAAAMASFALTMKACEYDSRFLRRGVRPRITCLRRAELDEGELQLVSELGKRTALLDAMAHADECGSLFAPDAADLAALDEALRVLDEQAAAGNLFADAARDKLRQMQQNCAPLARTYDVVVANPPYMGSSNMNKWLASWTKKSYPDSKRDLCTCFVERGFTLADASGYSAMVTMQSWMFLGSFEAMRGKLLASCSIVSMAHLGTRAFSAIGGEVVATTATVYSGAHTDAAATYLRLVDFENEQAKEQAIREAIENPDCGWFYRRSASSFSKIPGTPIAYWASGAMLKAFENPSLGSNTETHLGMATCNNDRFLRLWHEVSSDRRGAPSDYPYSDFIIWLPYNKGGQFKKWYGNNEYVVNWGKGGVELRKAGAVLVKDSLNFQPMVSWSRVSSGVLAVRYKEQGYLFDMTGPAAFGRRPNLLASMAFLNSAVGMHVARFMSATLDFQPGQISQYPFNMKITESEDVLVAASYSVDLSKSDYDSFETSWDFKRHPLV